MARWNGKRWLTVIRTGIALPVFALFYLFAPDPLAESHREFPIEVTRSMDGGHTVTEAMSWPTSDWRPMTSPSVTPSSSGIHEIWARINIPTAKSGESARRLVAEVGVATAREIDFYLTTGAAVVASKNTGLNGIEKHNPRSSMAYDFAFNESPTQAKTIYIRVEGTGFLIAPMQVREESDYLRYLGIRNFLINFLQGISFGICLYHLIFVLFLRKLYHIYFTAGLIFVSLFAATLNGILSDLGLYKNHSELMQIAITLCIASIVSYALFAKSFLSLAKNLPAYNRRLNITLGLLTLGLLALPFTNGAQVVFIITGILTFLVVEITLRTIRFEMLPSIQLFNEAMRGLLIGTTLTVVSWFGLMPSNTVIDRSYVLGQIWSGIFLSAAIIARAKELEHGNRIVQDTLKGIVPKNRLNSMLRDAYLEHYSASELAVTIMFIDIVSFTKYAENNQNDIVYKTLSSRLDEIIKIVINHGGTVDRSLGDGVLCFFGYEKSGFTNRHVLNALNAARDIQRQTLNHYQKFDPETSSEQPKLPVRIGIHTDMVTIGNVGNHDLADFTLVGNGVNFASRLETACNPFKIMVSAETRNLLLNKGVAKDEFQEILIAVKHSEDLTRAYEIDPNKGSEASLRDAMAVYHDYLGLVARSQRHQLQNHQMILLVSSYGRFRVVDLSIEGFQLHSANFLAPNAKLTASIETNDEQVNQKLRGLLIDEITVNIRWSRKADGGFIHGASTVGGHKDQSKVLFDLLLSTNTRDSKVMKKGDHHAA